MDNVASHVERLAQYLLNRAHDLGIIAKTPADSVGPLVVLQSKDSALLVQKLAGSDIVASNRHRRLTDIVPGVQHRGRCGGRDGSSEEESGSYGS